MKAFAMEYTLRQRMSLVIEANMTAEKITAMRDAEIDHAFLLEHNISTTLLRASKITPLQLKAHGTNTVDKLSELGFTTLHLLDDAWCIGCVSAYGAPKLLDAFLATTNDAVVLAASPAITLLGINLGILLLMCCEQPVAAREVLAQYKHVRNVPPETLLETGLRAKDLQPLGYTKARLREDTYATDAQLSLLGY